MVVLKTTEPVSSLQQEAGNMCHTEFANNGSNSTNKLLRRTTDQTSTKGPWYQQQQCVSYSPARTRRM